MPLEKFKMGMEFLKEQPWVGASSGFGSWTLLSANFFTNPNILNYVGIFAAWAGAVVCGLTVLLKTMELVEKISKRFKR